MKIKTILQISILFLIFIVIFASGIFFYLNQSINKAESQRSQANEIVRNIMDIRLLTFDYALHHEERARLQWEYRYKALAKLLSKIDSSSPKNKVLLGEIRQNYQDINDLFLSIVHNTRLSPQGANVAANEELTTRLTEQLLTKSQEMIAGALSVSESNDMSLKVAQKRATIFILLISILMCFLIINIYILFRRRIIRPLERLQKGTVQIAEGDLSYRVDSKGHDEIAELTRSFNSMTAKLEEIDTMKSDFISLAAHQLRSPINSLRWNIEILLKKSETETPGVKNKLQDIYESSLRLVTLSDSLLNISRIEKHYISPSYEAINITDLITEIIKEFTHEIKQKSLHILFKPSFPKKTSVMLDRYLVSDIFRNLISNAIKYSHRGGSIDIKVDIVSHKLHFSISDSGIGIPQKDYKNIYTKFFRASNANFKDANASSGLGLFVAKSYVKILGGEITFESRESQGTTFVVDIPLGEKTRSRSNP